MNFLIDTHCHIHSLNYPKNKEAVYQDAVSGGVHKMICIGTDISDSREAVTFAMNHEAALSAVGVHPHEAQQGISGLERLVREQKVVGVGEIGLDYYYEHSDRDIQRQILEQQIQLALDYSLPIIFHVRDAFDDFWPIFHNFPGVKGVLHSFTDRTVQLEQALANDLYIGINGISTFTKDIKQKVMYKIIPLERMLLETDAPYLTPIPYRGKVNEPAYVKTVAEHIASDRSIDLERVVRQTTHNATHLFQI